MTGMAGHDPGISGHVRPESLVTLLRNTHYTVRPLELLALHHGRIEAWILEQDGIVFDAQAEPGKLRVVA
jgi:hypothetical protein